MRKLLTVLCLAALLPTAQARADDDCYAPMTDWQPREAVTKLASEKGWKLRRIRIDDGCYEVNATDTSGRDIEVTIHPATLVVMKVEDDEDDDD